MKEDLAELERRMYDVERAQMGLVNVVLSLITAATSLDEDVAVHFLENAKIQKKAADFAGDPAASTMIHGVILSIEAILDSVRDR